MVSWTAKYTSPIPSSSPCQDLSAHLYDHDSPGRKLRVLDAVNSSLMVECPEYLKVENSSLDRLFQKNACEKPPNFYVNSSRVKRMEIEHLGKLIMNSSDIENIVLKTVCSTFITNTEITFFDVEIGDNEYTCNNSNTASIWKRVSVSELLSYSKIYIRDSILIEHSVLVSRSIQFSIVKKKTFKFFKNI